MRSPHAAARIRRRLRRGPPPRVDRPLGFLLLTVAAVCILYNAFLAVSYTGPAFSSPRATLWYRALDALVGATALVAAVALWFMRRWVVAAVTALIVALELWLVTTNVIGGNPEGAVVAVLMSMAVVGPVFAYVFNTAAKLFPSTP